MTCSFRPMGTVKLSMTHTSSSAISIVGIGRNIRVANYGNNDAYVNLTQSFASATTGDMIVLARTVEVFDRGCNTVVAAIGRDGSTVLDITSGEGC